MVTVEGTPNRAIHPLRKACATVDVLLSGMGMASGQRVNRSIIVTR